MKIIYVTERQRIAGDPLGYLTRLLSGQPDALLIREKDLSADALYAFAAPLVPIARHYGVPLILRGTPEAARCIGITHLQLSYTEAIAAPLPQGVDSVGISVHSLEEALAAEHLGADSITYGHIFASPCKPNLPPRGTAALEEIIQACNIPVHAIGGITASTLPRLCAIKPAAACLMSASMTDPHPETLTTRLRSIIEHP